VRASVLTALLDARVVFGGEITLPRWLVQINSSIQTAVGTITVCQCRPRLHIITQTRCRRDLPPPGRSKALAQQRRRVTRPLTPPPNKPPTFIMRALKRHPTTHAARLDTSCHTLTPYTRLWTPAAIRRTPCAHAARRRRFHVTGLGRLREQRGSGNSRRLRARTVILATREFLQSVGSPNAMEDSDCR